MKQLHALPCPADYVPLALMLPKRKLKHLIDIRIRMQNRALNIPILPTDVNRSVADYTYSVQMTVLPFLRQGREQNYPLLIALDNHLRNSRRCTEIAVNLEWRVHVKQIRICR